MKKLSLILCCLLLLFGSIAYTKADDSSSSSYLTLISPDQNGYKYGNYITTLFLLEDNNNNHYLAYCADHDVKASTSSKYHSLDISASTHYSAEDIAHLKTIIRNSYPFISMNELRARCGINSLGVKDAITASQLAIWHYSNHEEFEPYKDNTAVNNLYSWLLNTTSQDISSSVDANMHVFIYESEYGRYSSQTLIGYSIDSPTDLPPITTRNSETTSTSIQETTSTPESTSAETTSVYESTSDEATSVQRVTTPENKSKSAANNTSTNSYYSATKKHPKVSPKTGDSLEEILVILIALSSSALITFIVGKKGHYF